MGYDTTACGGCQTVMGKFNCTDTTSALIIGNGTNAGALSDALTVDFSGNLTTAGTITENSAATSTFAGNICSAGNVVASAFFGDGSHLTGISSGMGTSTVLGLFSGTSPITYNSGTGAIGITQSGTSTNGYLSSTDWNTFNNKVSTTSLASYVPYTGATGDITTAHNICAQCFIGDGSGLINVCATCSGYATNSGCATTSGGHASTAGTASTASSSGYASTAGTAGCATCSGYSTNSGYATNAGCATCSGYSTNSGYATNAGCATCSGYSVIPVVFCSGYAVCAGCVLSYAETDPVFTAWKGGTSLAVVLVPQLPIVPQR